MNRPRNLTKKDLIQYKETLRLTQEQKDIRNFAWWCFNEIN